MPQRHTAKRIFDRLRAEYGFTGGYTIVKDYVRRCQPRNQEMFIPLPHAPGTSPGRLRAGAGDCGRGRVHSALSRHGLYPIPTTSS
jgi:hypothetical protein